MRTSDHTSSRAPEPIRAAQFEHGVRTECFGVRAARVLDISALSNPVARIAVVSNSGNDGEDEMGFACLGTALFFFDIENAAMTGLPELELHAQSMGARDPYGLLVTTAAATDD